MFHRESSDPCFAKNKNLRCIIIILELKICKKRMSRYLNLSGKVSQTFSDFVDFSFLNPS